MSTVYKYGHDWTLALDPGVVRKGLWLQTDIEGAGLTSTTSWYSTFVDAGNDGGYPVNDGGALIVPYDTGTTIEPRSYNWLAVDQVNTLSEIDNKYYKRNAARGEWICVENVSVTLAFPFPETKLYRRLPSGFGTPIFTSQGYPEAKGDTLIAGYIYYADKPFYISCPDNNNSVIPTNMKSNMFANYSSRYGSSTYRFYNPGSQAVRVDIFYEGAGINGTPIHNIPVSPGSIETYTGTNDTGWYYFLAKGGDICMSVEEAGGDKHVMNPACKTIYTRRSGYDKNMIGGGPSVQGTYHNQDSNRCVSVEIADGSGGDSCQHVGLENLSNTYTFGGPLSDYHITSPFTQSIEVYYATGDGTGPWILLNTHSLTGSLLSPGEIGVDGEGGSPYDGSGAAAYLAGGATMWMFKSLKPFQITVNDSSNDEEPLFGWMENEDVMMFDSESDLLDYIDSVNDYYRITFPV